MRMLDGVVIIIGLLVAYAVSKIINPWIAMPVAIFWCFFVFWYFGNPKRNQKKQ